MTIVQLTKSQARRRVKTYLCRARHYSDSREYNLGMAAAYMIFHHELSKPNQSLSLSQSQR